MGGQEAVQEDSIGRSWTHLLSQTPHMCSYIWNKSLRKEPENQLKSYSTRKDKKDHTETYSCQNPQHLWPTIGKKLKTQTNINKYIHKSGQTWYTCSYTCSFSFWSEGFVFHARYHNPWCLKQSEESPKCMDLKTNRNYIKENHRAIKNKDFSLKRVTCRTQLKKQEFEKCLDHRGMNFTC